MNPLVWRSFDRGVVAETGVQCFRGARSGATGGNAHRPVPWH